MRSLQRQYTCTNLCWQLSGPSSNRRSHVRRCTGGYLANRIFCFIGYYTDYQVWVSYDNVNWGSNPIYTSQIYDSQTVQHDFYGGDISNTFRYIAIVCYDTGLSYNMFVDNVAAWWGQSNRAINEVFIDCIAIILNVKVAIWKALAFSVWSGITFLVFTWSTNSFRLGPDA